MIRQPSRTTSNSRKADDKSPRSSDSARDKSSERSEEVEDDRKPCEKCSGNGFFDSSRKPTPNKVFGGFTCHNCNGNKKTSRPVMCGKCKGCGAFDYRGKPINFEWKEFSEVICKSCHGFGYLYESSPSPKS
eukprot:TRINITY_DN3446_c0_g1_i1.p1 TRINITY_DN3446_c0_g1~~TRINITY_DN3446_c0_g1_i1.p1  ORF type:complete len:132 (+),score=20.60 TRINITY_DN3446_c0_g1_i1:151-546(+)